MTDFIGWSVFLSHCVNHRLEVGMKDAFLTNNIFSEMREMLDVLYRLFRNSGKSWRIYQLLGEKLEINVLRFVRCTGTRFQAHTLKALANFIRNLLVSLLFVENVEQQGSGVNSIVTKEMYSKLVGFRKKWGKFEFVATTNLYYRVLRETSHLSLVMESESILIYQVANAVKEACEALKDVKDEDGYDYLPFNVEYVGDGDENNFLMRDSRIVQVSAANENLKQTKMMSEEDRKECESKIHVVKDKFNLFNVTSGKVKVDKTRNDFSTSYYRKNKRKI